MTKRKLFTTRAEAEGYFRSHPEARPHTDDRCEGCECEPTHCDQCLIEAAEAHRDYHAVSAAA